MNSSNAKSLYKGKPSKMVLALDANTAFEGEVHVKPASAGSRKAFYQKMATVADQEESGNQAEALDTMSKLAIDLILITACDTKGTPFFDVNDKAFIAEELESVYYDQLVAAGCDILGLPASLKKGLLLNMDEATEETEKKPEEQPVVSNQTTQENQQE